MIKCISNWLGAVLTSDRISLLFVHTPPAQGSVGDPTEGGGNHRASEGPQ